MSLAEADVRTHTLTFSELITRFGHELVVPFVGYLRALFGNTDIEAVDASTTSKEMSLSDRVNKYGKIRFLFICDENLGRSRLFAAAFNQLLKATGFDEIAESVSAGTDVEIKKSYDKYPDGLPETVRREISTHGVNKEDEVAKQLRDYMATPNTIAIILNKPRKVRKSFRDKCHCSINASLDDPGRLKKGQAKELSRLSNIAFSYCSKLHGMLRIAINSNDLSVFQSHTVDMSELDIDDFF